MEASLRDDEDQRIAALRSYDILDTPREDEFDEMVRVVAAICGTPIAVINLIDEGRQWFKAEVGLGVRETPLPASICAHAILQPGLFVVPDTLQDTRFSDNPLVTGAPGLRFYAGALLKTADNLPLGTVCVLDYQPRELDQNQQDLLKLMANQVMKMFDLRRARQIEKLARINAENLVAANERLALAVLESERRLKQTLKDGGLGYWTLDLETRVLEASESCKLNFGFAADALFTYDDLLSSIHPGDRSRMAAAVESTIQTGVDYNVSYEIAGPNGFSGAVLIRGRLHHDEHGQPASMSGISLDISELRRVEDKLAISEERLNLALNAAGTIGTWDWDLKANLAYADANFARIYGMDPAWAATGRPQAEFIANYHPEDMPMIRAALERVFAGASDYENEHRLLLKDGSVRWVHARGRLIRDADGNPARFPGASVDITARKEAEVRQRMLMTELAHRVKNTLAMVQGLTTQTLKNAGSLKEAGEIIRSRIAALAHAHDILLQESWSSASIRAIVEGSAKLLGEADADRIHIVGPNLTLGPQYALALALVMHELGTNAIKYGSLSNSDGHVEVTWSVGDRDGDRRFKLRWQEIGGPLVQQPARRGFGSRLIESSLAGFGQVSVTYASTGFVLDVDGQLAIIQQVEDV